jgi:hypothetical protein
MACPACGREPATGGEALRQREDIASIWLHLDGDHLTEARHWVACRPHEPVIDVSCSGCGRGPLDHRAVTRARRPTRAASARLAALPRLAPPPGRHARRPEIAASIKSPCALTLKILHQSSSQADS